MAALGAPAVEPITLDAPVGDNAPCTPSPPRRRRLVAKRLDEAYLIGTPHDVSVGSSASRATRWADLPQDLGVLVCQCLGAKDVVSFIVAGRRTHDISGNEEVWRFFCSARWGKSANVTAYRSAKDLYLDSNGWFPLRCGKKQSPRFEVQSFSLHNSPCLTMDMRMTNEEIVTVSEAAKDQNGAPQQACVHVIDPGTLRTRQRLEVSCSTINCCDVGPGVICTGSDDFKVRIYRKAGASSADGHAGSYKRVAEIPCSSEVNDLRFAQEDYVIAVRTHQNRHPAGLDLIPVERPESLVSFQGGSVATRGKYIHALDGFEDGCSMNGIACSGEHPLTSAFSAMLFDFRRASPCVVDLPVTSEQQGHPNGTMLWPLRAGRSPKVYANLLHETADVCRRTVGGAIAMVDFRFPSMEVVDLFRLPHPVDDFRCFGGDIYAACTEVTDYAQRLHLHRCVPGQPGTSECLCTVVEDYDAGGRSAKEDLKVFSICARGFAVSYGEQLSLGRVVEPLEHRRKADLRPGGVPQEALTMPPPLRPLSRRSLLVDEELLSWQDVCS